MTTLRLGQTLLAVCTCSADKGLLYIWQKSTLDLVSGPCSRCAVWHLVSLAHSSQHLGN